MLACTNVALEVSSRAAAPRAMSTRCLRRSTPTNDAAVVCAPTRQNLPTPEPTSRIRVAPCCVSNLAARAATRTGVQCCRERSRIALS